MVTYANPSVSRINPTFTDNKDKSAVAFEEEFEEFARSLFEWEQVALSDPSILEHIPELDLERYNGKSTPFPERMNPLSLSWYFCSCALNGVWNYLSKVLSSNCYGFATNIPGLRAEDPGFNAEHICEMHGIQSTTKQCEKTSLLTTLRDAFAGMYVISKLKNRVINACQKDGLTFCGSTLPEDKRTLQSGFPVFSIAYRMWHPLGFTRLGRVDYHWMAPRKITDDDGSVRIVLAEKNGMQAYTKVISNKGDDSISGALEAIRKKHTGIMGALKNVSFIGFFMRPSDWSVRDRPFVELRF